MRSALPAPLRPLLAGTGDAGASALRRAVHPQSWDRPLLGTELLDNVVGAVEQHLLDVGADPVDL
jgi:hypothetical protein